MRFEIMSLREASEIYGLREFLPPEMIDCDEFMCKVTRIDGGYRFSIFDRGPHCH